MNRTRELIFVYNAKSGFAHPVMDLMHKTASPKTYPCKLCSLTYSGATMNKLWKSYVADLGLPTIFMHRNEFAEAYPDQHISLPTILLKSGSSFKILISREEFSDIKDLGGLMQQLATKLEDAAPAKQYQCPECGLHYEDEAIMKKCAAWCSEYKSCNLEIIRHSVEQSNSKII
jgi:rubredoxin